MPAQKLDKHSLKILNMEPTGITTNNSHQQLMSDSDSVDVSVPNNNAPIVTLRDISVRQWMTVSILCFVNLINYMDRFTIAGRFTFIYCFNYFLSCYMQHVAFFTCDRLSGFQIVVLELPDLLLQC